MAGNHIHHPKALCGFSQVLGAICQQVPAADTVVLLSANKLIQLTGIKLLHFNVLCCLHEHSLFSDKQMDNRHLVTR
jgi:hypothetical protein